MTLYCAIDDVPVIHGTVTIPYSGIWVADVVMQEPKDVNGRHILQLSDAKLSCTVIRAIDFAGARGIRLLGGAAGWRNQVPSKQYGSFGVSVLLSIVLNDAAREVGEVIALATDKLLPTYLRGQGPASEVLNDRLGPSWWMDFDGIVQTKPRDPSPIGSDFIAESVMGAAGIWKIATETVTDWLPGRTFVGPTSKGTISRVQHHIARGSLRTVVMTS